MTVAVDVTVGVQVGEGVLDGVTVGLGVRVGVEVEVAVAVGDGGVSAQGPESMSPTESETLFPSAMASESQRSSVWR